MATVTVNDRQLEVADDATLVDVVALATGRSLTPDGRPSDGGRLGIAISLDGTVVPRASWSQRRVTDGVALELVTAVQGG
ncbi:sulfur carrier protein ThiS [Kocuria massiliensis]|uniref:sulfur carrier protein ThiS n=1 Tax=Kocuria massiliensis TaxID=1926282 RepID=UPI0022B99FD2|nr:sulfur carrier protein ThiS [Kocuria massiliensis]